MVPVTSTNPPGETCSYLIPCELRWELPVEQIILLRAETFVDQSGLRGRQEEEGEEEGEGGEARQVRRRRQQQGRGGGVKEATRKKRRRPAERR